MNEQQWHFVKRSLPALMCALTVVAGCGSRSKGTVSGSVTHQGRKLTGGSVVFLTEKNRVFISPISGDGAYRILGIPAGVVKIGVQAPGQVAAEQAGMDAAPDPAPPPPPVSIPETFADPNSSGLTLAVAPGVQAYDIQLE
jgi:hypothetical protein